MYQEISRSSPALLEGLTTETRAEGAQRDLNAAVVAQHGTAPHMGVMLSESSVSSVQQCPTGKYLENLISHKLTSRD